MADYAPKDWAHLELIEEPELDHVEQGIADSVQTNPSTAKNDITPEADVQSLILRSFPLGAANIFEAYDNGGTRRIYANNIGQLFVDRLQRIATFGNAAFSDQYIELRGSTGARWGLHTPLNGGSGGILFESGDNKTILFRVDNNVGFGGGGLNALGIETNAMVGAQLQSPKSGLHAGTSFGHKVANFTTTATLDSTETVALCNTASGAFTLTLPAAASCADRLYRIKKKSTDINTLTIDGNGAETIDGNATITLATPYSSVDLVSDGSAWFIL